VHRECNVTKRVQTGKGLRYALSCCLRMVESNETWCWSANLGTIPKAAITSEWRESGQRKRLSVGKDAADATAHRLRKEAELNAKNNGVVMVTPESKNGHRLLSAAISEWHLQTGSCGVFAAVEFF
jgi:hypothetical protein